MQIYGKWHNNCLVYRATTIMSKECFSITVLKRKESITTTVAAVIKTKLTNMKCGQFYDYLLTQPLKEIGGVETVIVLYFNNSFSTHNFIQILNNIILIPFNQFSLLLTYILLLLLYYRILFLI